MANLNLNILSHGGKLNESSFDSTPLLQELIDYVFSKGGGSIEFPSGSYFFKGTVSLKRGVSIVGYGENVWNGNTRLGTDKGAYFSHIPEKPNSDFITLSQSDLLEGYFGAVNIKNLYIGGSVNSNIGLKLDKIVNGKLENLQIIDFGINIKISGAMKTEFEKVSSMRARDFCLKMAPSISTSTSFYRCYFGQSFSKPESIPISIDSDVALGVDFISCLVESTVKGLDIGSGNVVNFTDLYTEHVPSNPSSEAIINIGSTNSVGNDKGTYTFIGGTVAGSNSGIHPNSKIFNVDYIGALTVVGVKMARSNRAISTTTNSKGITFIGCYDMQLTNDITRCNEKGIINIIGGSSGSNQAEYPNQLRRFKMATSAGKSYDIVCDFTQTETDLRFVSSANGTPLWLDYNANVRHHFNGPIGTALKVNAYGAIPSPTWAGTASGAFMWAEMVDGVVLFKHRDSSGRIYTMGSSTTTAASRPTTGNYAGRNIFDTDLNKPLWRNSTNTGWVDSNGNTV